MARPRKNREITPAESTIKEMSRPSLTPENANQLLDVFSEEVRVRKLEAENESQKTTSNERIAITAMKHQADYLEKQQQNQAKIISSSLWFIIVALLLVLGFFTVCVWKGESELVKDLFKIAAGIAMGWIGGYAHKSNKSDGPGIPKPERED